MQNTKFVNILYTKIEEIKILCDNECTTKTRNGLKLEMHVFCSQKHCINYAKPIELAT